VPAVAIEHLVPPARLTQRWFIKRFYWQGVSDAVMRLIEDSPSPARRLRLALARARAVVRSLRRLKGLVARTSDPETFRWKCRALIDIGYVAGLLGAAKR
jgi:hypothetical protein